MTKKRRIDLAVAVIMGALVIVGGMVWSAEKEKRRGVEHVQVLAAAHAQTIAMVRASTVPIDQAIKIALENFPGTVSEAGLEARYGTVVWEVEIVMADGEVRVIHIDAESGGVINTEDHVAG
jgi:uncharacterized membrane protein YkoI